MGCPTCLSVCSLLYHDKHDNIDGSLSIRIEVVQLYVECTN